MKDKIMKDRVMKVKVMKRVIIFLFGIAVLFGQNIHAQDLRMGFHIGGNLAGYTGGKQYIIYDKSSKAGYEVGTDIQYLLKNKISIASGISLLQTGGKFSVMSSYASSTGHGETEFPTVSTKALSLEIPLKFGFDISLSNGFVLTPTVGAYGRYALSSIKDKVNIIGDKTNYKWDCYKDFNKDMHHIDAMKKFEYGVVVGIGTKISNHYMISLNYKRGLNTLSSQYELKKSDFSCTIGYIW